MLAASIAFSLLACVLLALAGRRDPAGLARVSTLAIAILLALPLLTLAPKLPILPASATTFAEASADTRALPGWLLGTWIAGSLAFGLRLGVALVRVAVWRRRARTLGSDGRTTIAELEGLPQPVATGILRPMILVPRDFSRRPESERRMILAHEQAHHHRHDPLWRLLGAIACALYWFNPLVWWLVRRYQAQAELACDAAVLQQGAAPKRYATLILAQALTARAATPLAAPFARRHGVERRVRHLLSPHRPHGGVLVPALLALLTFSGLAIALLRQAENPPPAAEIELRHTANPFPGDN